MVKNIFFEKKFLVVLEYAQMHQNTSLNTPDGKVYLFWKKVSGGLEVCAKASKHVLNHSRRSKISFLKKSFLWSGSMRKCIKTRLRLEWLKTCFDAFAHTSRSPETFYQKRYFWKSGVVKNVFSCICAYFQTTRIFFFQKDIFNRLEWLKTCFDAFSHTSRPPETFFQKRYQAECLLHKVGGLGRTTGPRLSSGLRRQQHRGQITGSERVPDQEEQRGSLLWGVPSLDYTGKV